MLTVVEKNLSSFGQTAIALDGDISKLQSLSKQIEELDIESDFGLEFAQKTLARFAEVGQRIAGQVQELAKNLDEARIRAEQAANLVAKRAEEIRDRILARDKQLEEFRLLSEKVREVSGDMALLRGPVSENPTVEVRDGLLKQMAEFESRLDPLIAQADHLRNEAQLFKMKTLEKNADALRQSLQAARKKLGSVNSNVTNLH